MQNLLIKPLVAVSPMNLWSQKIADLELQLCHPVMHITCSMQCVKEVFSPLVPWDLKYGQKRAVGLILRFLLWLNPFIHFSAKIPISSCCGPVDGSILGNISRSKKHEFVYHPSNGRVELHHFSGVENWPLVITCLQCVAFQKVDLLIVPWICYFNKRQRISLPPEFHGMSDMLRPKEMFLIVPHGPLHLVGWTWMIFLPLKMILSAGASLESPVHQASPFDHFDLRRRHHFQNFLASSSSMCSRAQGGYQMLCQNLEFLLLNTLTICMVSTVIFDVSLPSN